jgi:hypothetical protein
MSRAGDRISRRLFLERTRQAIAARDLFNEGRFGTLFYSEVEYYHPGVCWPANDLSRTVDDKGGTWRYGFPPMHYPTHSLGFPVGVTKERFTEISCLGWANPADGAFKDNVYNAPFNVQSGLFKTNKGHLSRGNVFWDGKAEGERAQWFGTDLAFYMPGSGGQPFRMDGKNAPKWRKVPQYWKRLPEPMRHDSGHGGSHTFLTHEFIAALVEQREPTMNIHEALAMTAPGIIAHESSLKGGEQMKVPSFDREA